MGIVEKLKEKLGSQPEDAEISWEEAPEFFEERKKRDIERAEERAEEMKQRTSELVEDIDEGLEAFNDYDDSENLKVVEDVAQNFYRTRKRLIENFDPSEDVEEHLEDLKEFVGDFNDVSRKEGEVMKYVRKDAPQLSDALDQLVEHRDEMDDFVETRYQNIVQLEKVREYVEEIEQAEEDLEEAEEELEGKDTRSIKQDIQDIEQKIDEVEDTEEWQELKTLEKEREELEKKRERKRKRIKNKASKMERGLKKIVYNVENEDLSFEGDLDVLKKVRDEEIQELSDPSEEIEEAGEIVREKGLLGERQEEKFLDAAEFLEGFEERMQELEDLLKEKEDIEERIEGLEVDEKKDELKERKQKLEDDLREKKDSVRELEEERNSREREKQKKMIELEHFMNSLIRGTVTVEEIDRDRAEA